MIKLSEIESKYGEYLVDEDKLKELLVKPEPKTVWDLEKGDKYYHISSNFGVLPSAWYNDAPYNLSQSVIGFLFAVQLFGTFSSAAAGKLNSKFGNGTIICSCLFLLAIGAVLTTHSLLIVKIAGLAVLTLGLFGAHASASGWCGKLVENGKAAAGSLYMFSYYSGASILGSLGGIFYSSFGWSGVAGMSVFSAALAFTAVRVAMAK